jgi:hypothetical protein
MPAGGAAAEGVPDRRRRFSHEGFVALLNVALGDQVLALGGDLVALGDRVVALGGDLVALGVGVVALGDGLVALGHRLVALGD